MGVSLVLLLFCRLANVMVPLTFKHAVDLLTEVQAAVSHSAYTCSRVLTCADVC